MAILLEKQGQLVDQNFRNDTGLVSMKNVTTTLDEETARWARLQAATRGTS